MQMEQSELAKFLEPGSKGEKKLRESQRRNSETANFWEPGSKGKKSLFCAWPNKKNPVILE